MKKIYCFLLLCFFLSHPAKAVTFQTYDQLGGCIGTNTTFLLYKKNLQNCFKEKGITIGDESLNIIEKDFGIIDDIIKLDLPKDITIKKKKNLTETLSDLFKPADLEKIAEEENIFNKPTVFSDEYKESNFSLNDKDFKNLNNHIKKNPENIYSLTKDINNLTYKNKYLSEFKRQEILLNIYNTFDVVVLASKVPPPSTPTNFGTPGALTGLVAAGAVAIAAGGSGGSGGSGGGSTPSGDATLSFSSSSTSIGECDANITITANLTKTHSEAVIVNYTIGGTATRNTDYSLNQQSVTIVQGATSAAITLDPTNDRTAETSETVTFAAAVSGIDPVSTTGNTTTTVTIHDYVLRCATAFSEGTTSEQNTIKNRSSFRTVDQSSNSVHPYELTNIHKAHSFKSGSTTLTGNGQLVFVIDGELDANHDSFAGKTVTKLDNTAPSNSSAEHGTHVSSTIVGIVAGTTHGIAPDASLIYSTFNLNGTSQAAHMDTARNNGAVVMNNSWHYHNGSSASEWFELVASANSNGNNIRQELTSGDFRGNHVFGSHTSAYITALDNFQNTGVVVWANSNYGNDTDTSMMPGLPNYFNGVDDSVDLTDAWLSVMFAEFTGSSLTGASTSDFNRLGNPCNNSKEWCLVVDDRQIAAAGFVDGNGVSQYTSMGGSSMGAPQVSGMIALLSQAFPNHTPEQLTDRLLASANNAWFTPSGNTTFTTHGASIKHGYNTEWGHGVPDMYAALSPITSDSNAASFGFATPSGSGGSGGSGSVPFSGVQKLAVSETTMSLSSSLGDGIMNGLKGKTAYAYDALNAGFKFNVSDLINYDTLTEQKIEFSLEEEINNLRNFKFSDNKSAKDFDIYAGEYLNFRDKYNRGLSVTLDQPNLALQNFNLYNNQSYKNPFTSENKGAGFNNKFYFMGNNVLLGYNNSNFNPLTNINKDVNVPLETLALSFNLNNDNFDLLSFTTGLLKEENTFLLSEGSGAFDLNDKDNLSNFYGLNLSKSLNNLGNIYFSTMFGNSKLDNAKNSLIVDTSNVLSSSFEINYELKNLFKNDQFSVSLSQPNRVEQGDMTFRFMGLADRNGVLPYQDHKVDLSPSGRQKDLTLNYITNHSKNLKTGIKAIITDDLGHIKNNSLDTNLLLSATFNF